jgi:hypothetical protein
MVGQRRLPGNRRRAAGGFSRRARPGVASDRLSWRPAVTQVCTQRRTRRTVVSFAFARGRGPGLPAGRSRPCSRCRRWCPACYGGDFFDRLVDPDATAAFRITKLTLVDPHTYSGDMVLCQDSTATYNQFFAKNIAQFDINTALVLHPLDPAKDSDHRDIVPANCVPGGTLVNCTDKDVPTSSIVTADFNNIEGGTCGNPVAGSLEPRCTQTGASERAQQAHEPLLPQRDDPLAQPRPRADARLPLSNVQISAAYDLERAPSRCWSRACCSASSPPASAMSSIGSAQRRPLRALVGARRRRRLQGRPSTTSTPSRLPKDGVWMYFNFTAERVAWSSESDPIPGDSTSTSL